MAVDTAAVELALDTSKGAHLAYRDAVSRGDSRGARNSMQTAYDQRMAAQALDPLFESAVWQQMDGLYPHIALVHFYRDQLAR